jgi:hypothetical protein
VSFLLRDWLGMLRTWSSASRLQSEVIMIQKQDMKKNLLQGIQAWAVTDTHHMPRLIIKQPRGKHRINLIGERGSAVIEDLGRRYRKSSVRARAV